jgi:hypothetical protein
MEEECCVVLTRACWPAIWWTERGRVLEGDRRDHIHDWEREHQMKQRQRATVLYNTGEYSFHNSFGSHSHFQLTDSRSTKLFKKYTAFCGARRLITVYTKGRHWNLSKASWIQYTLFLQDSSRKNYSRSPKSPLPFRYFDENILRMRATNLADLMFLDFVTLRIFGVEHIKFMNLKFVIMLYSSFSCYFHVDTVFLCYSDWTSNTQTAFIGYVRNQRLRRIFNS